MFIFNDDAVIENIGFLSYTTTTNMFTSATAGER